MDGHFPVRWTENFGRGYGLPVFQFYAPLPYYVGSFFYILGFPWAITMKLLMIIPTVVTFFGMYVLGATIWNKKAGLVCAVAACLAPYRAVDLFVRGALSEIWGMMAIPWAVLGAIWIIQGKKWGSFIFIIGIVAMLLSHNLTAFVFALTIPIVVLGYLLLFSKSKWPQIFILSRSVVIAIVLTAFYIFPAALEEKYTNISNMTEGYFNYSNHFVYIRQLLKPYWGYGNSGPWPYNDMSYFLGYGQLLGMITGVLALGVLWVRKKEKFFKNKEALFILLLLGVTVVSLVMMNVRSQPIWTAFPLLSMLQFPWRWLLVATFLVALVNGFAVGQVKKPLQQNILVGVLIATTLLLNAQFFRPKEYLLDDGQFYGTEPEQVRSQMKDALYEYYPLTSSNLDVVPVGLVAQFIDGSGTIAIEKNLTHYKRIHVTTSAATTVEFLTLDFPGWTLQLDGKNIPIELTKNGTISMQVPAGQHSIAITFGSTSVRKISDTVSLIGWAVFIWVLIFSFEKNKKFLHAMKRKYKWGG